MPHLVYGNGTDRGYMLLRVAPDAVTAEWWYVDTIASRDFSQRCEKALKVTADDPAGGLREAACS